MHALRDISIKRKLVLITMAASTVALLLISAALVTYELITFRQLMKRDIATQAQIIGSQSTAALIYDDVAAAEEILSALKANRHIVAAGIFKNRKLFTQYPKEMAKDSLPANPMPTDPIFENNHLILVRPIILKGEEIGLVYLKYDLKELNGVLEQFGGIILLFMLVSSLVTFFLSSVLQRIISEPFAHLVQTAKAVSAGRDYTVRAVKQSADELGQFVDVFNEMLAQIQERDAALQQAHDKLEKRVEERTRDLQLEVAERRRAQEALQRQLGRISLLNQITQVISERQDLSSILQVVLRQLEEHAPVDMGSVFLLEPQSDTLSIAAIRERNPVPAAKSGLSPSDTLSLEQSGLITCREGETVYVRDTGEVKSELARMLAGAGLRCGVAVPMMVEGRLFGILVVARNAADSFSSAECEFLRILSEQVALAAHQARLHTELETAYNDLRQTQQAVMQQDRLRALGQMASGIAHDINNALSPVVGFAGLLLSYEPNLTLSAKKHLNYIKTAGEDVAHIVSRLREFYRHRDGHEALVPTSLNLLVGEVLDLTRPRWRDIPQEKGIMVEMNTSLETELPEVAGIASEIREALTNLILNAVDAMPDGGKLTVQTRTGGTALVGNGEAVPTHGILEVLDTGAGMSEKTRKHCLEPFYSTKGKRGTGMGLAMVYGVMERHEGKIEIESELGKGTTVRLIFPLRTKVSESAEQEVEVAAPANLQILCIDDEPLLRELVKEMLEREGHYVQSADGGQTGLDAFHKAAERGRPFDVVITDLGMPHVDGREVAKALKRNFPHVPVIMLTGWGAFMKGDGDKPLDVDGILSKPPRAKELNTLLGQLTRKPGAPRRN